MKRSDLFNKVYQMLVMVLVIISLINSNSAKAAEYTEKQAVSRVSVYIVNNFVVQTATTPTEQETSPNGSNKQGKLPKTSENQSYHNWLGLLIIGLLIIIKIKKKEGKNKNEIC